METKMIENILMNFGLLGVVLFGCGYGIWYSGTWIGSNLLRPLISKHIEFLDECVLSLKNLHDKVDRIDSKIR